MELDKRRKGLIIRSVIELVLLGGLIALDLCIKDYLYHYLDDGFTSKDLIKGFISLIYVENTGAGFGSFEGKTLLLSIITLILMVAITVFLAGSLVTEFLGKKSKKGSALKIDTTSRIAIVLILAGGIANLVDRFMVISGKYYFKGVRDFFNFEFMEFPVWNLADAYVVIGVALLVVYLIVLMIKDAQMVRSTQKANLAQEEERKKAEQIKIEEAKPEEDIEIQEVQVTEDAPIEETVESEDKE